MFVIMEPDICHSKMVINNVCPAKYYHQIVTIMKESLIMFVLLNRT